MVNSSRKNASIRNTSWGVLQFNKKPKTVPNVIFGINASQPRPGMEGLLDWLMSTKIHKYWPFFSNLTYLEMISLREENIDYYMDVLGAQGTFCTGSRRKILKSVEELRSRSLKLRMINPLDVEESCQTISSVLNTPISDNNMEEDGTYLTGLIIKKITEIVAACRKTGRSTLTVIGLLKKYIDCNSVHEYDKSCAKIWINCFRLERYRCRTVG